MITVVAAHGKAHDAHYDEPIRTRTSISNHLRLSESRIPPRRFERYLMLRTDAEFRIFSDHATRRRGF